MCNNNDMNNCENCIADILKVILLLQQSVCQNDTCLQTCDRGVLYTCSSGSTPLTMPISRSSTETETSSVFRLEKLDDCCATCRVLAPNTDDTATYPFVATNSFFTININCICILRCLDDTFVDTL